MTLHLPILQNTTKIGKSTMKLSFQTVFCTKNSNWNIFEIKQIIKKHQYFFGNIKIMSNFAG
jgi:hypothetical protein